DCGGHRRRWDRRPPIVRADERRAVFGGDQMRGERPGEPRARCRAHDRADEALARSTDQERQIKSAPSVEPCDAGKTLLGRFAEADSWIEHDLLPGNAGLPCDFERAREKLG